jgi:hypothetical protein
MVAVRCVSALLLWFQQAPGNAPRSLNAMDGLVLATMLLEFAEPNLMRKSVPARKPKTPTKPPRGRPPVHDEAWVKVSVVLFERQVIHLDRVTTDMRHRSGMAMNRAEVIRALIDGLISSGLDITQHGSEATLRTYIAKCLKLSR